MWAATTGVGWQCRRPEGEKVAECKRRRRALLLTSASSVTCALKPLAFMISVALQAGVTKGKGA